MNKPELDEFLDFVYKCPPEKRNSYFQAEFGMNADQFWESGIIDEAEDPPPEPPETRMWFDLDNDTMQCLIRAEIHEQNTARN